MDWSKCWPLSHLLHVWMVCWRELTFQTLSKDMKRSRSISEVAKPRKKSWLQWPFYSPWQRPVKEVLAEKPSLETFLQHMPKQRLEAFFEPPTAACLSLVVRGIETPMKFTAIETLQDINVVDGAAGECSLLPTSTFFFKAFKALGLKVARKLSLGDINMFEYKSDIDLIMSPNYLWIKWQFDGIENTYYAGFKRSGIINTLIFCDRHGTWEAIPPPQDSARKFQERLQYFELALQKLFLPNCHTEKKMGKLLIGGRSMKALLCTTLTEESISDSGVRIYATPSRLPPAVTAASRGVAQAVRHLSQAPKEASPPRRSPSPRRLNVRRENEIIHMSMADAESKTRQKERAKIKEKQQLDTELAALQEERRRLQIGTF